MGDNNSGSSSNGQELTIKIQKMEDGKTQQVLSEMGNNNSERYSNGKELPIKIPKDLKPLLSTPLSWPECCIYRVPRKLRKINPEAYTPQVVSIGPIHHGDKKLMGMHKLKLRYLADFCSRAKIDWSEIRMEIQDREKEIRRSYLDTFDELGKDEFIDIVLLDSVFVIELLWKEKSGIMDGYVSNTPWLDLCITRDLLLLENQLPYFILEHLYNFFCKSFSPPTPFDDLASSYFKDFTDRPRDKTKPRNHRDWCSCCYCFWVSRCFSREKTIENNVPGDPGDQTRLQNENHYCFWLSRCFFREKTSKNNVRGVPGVLTDLEYKKHNHFTDMIRKSLCSNPPELINHGDLFSNLHSIKALHEAGVKFEADPEAWPLRMKFEKGVLKMPRLHFDDNTECLFRNLMAYEQCHYPCDAYFCNYMLFLDSLINNEDDVQLLVQSGVVTNLLGHNKPVEDLVNSLGKQITETGNCYHKLHSELNNHCENSWYQKVAFVRRVYFGNVWKGTGTIVALILLVFTFIQSLNSMNEIL